MKIFLDANDYPTSSDTLEAADSYLDTREMFSTKVLTGATLSFDIGGSDGTHKVYIKFHNGNNWMKYHLAIDDANNSTFSSDDTVEINLGLQEFWKSTVAGVRVRITRETGEGDVPITNGILNVNTD